MLAIAESLPLMQLTGVTVYQNCTPLTSMIFVLSDEDGATLKLPLTLLIQVMSYAEDLEVLTRLPAIWWNEIFRQAGTLTPATCLKDYAPARLITPNLQQVFVLRELGDQQRFTLPLADVLTALYIAHLRGKLPPLPKSWIATNIADSIQTQALNIVIRGLDES